MLRREGRMKRFMVIAAVGAAAAIGSPAASAATTCAWAGTPTNPTGTFSISPGIRLVPATQALRFSATGPLSGGRGCRGRVTFDGQIDAGGTCFFATFRG